MTVIRTYAPKDTDAVVDVILPIQRIEFGIPITLDAQPDLKDIAAFYQRDQGNFWVAESEGVVVGTLALLDIGDGAAALRKMFVRASHRGPQHCIAQRLLDTLLDWCRARDLVRIYLGTTAAFAAAHRFYEKNGFAEVNATQLPAAFPRMAVDTKFYLRILATLSARS
jgi:N-acetylglutamate synthase-like GNAT family acetyltransferase